METKGRLIRLLPLIGEKQLRDIYLSSPETYDKYAERMKGIQSPDDIVTGFEAIINLCVENEYGVAYEMASSLESRASRQHIPTLLRLRAGLAFELGDTTTSLRLMNHLLDSYEMTSSLRALLQADLTDLTGEFAETSPRPSLDELDRYGRLSLAAFQSDSFRRAGYSERTRTYAPIADGIRFGNTALASAYARGDFRRARKFRQDFGRALYQQALETRKEGLLELAVNELLSSGGVFEFDQVLARTHHHIQSTEEVEKWLKRRPVEATGRAAVPWWENLITLAQVLRHLAEDKVLSSLTTDVLKAITALPDPYATVSPSTLRKLSRLPITTEALSSFLDYTLARELVPGSRAWLWDVIIRVDFSQHRSLLPKLMQEVIPTLEPHDPHLMLEVLDLVTSVTNDFDEQASEILLRHFDLVIGNEQSWTPALRNNDPLPGLNDLMQKATSALVPRLLEDQRTAHIRSGLIPESALVLAYKIYDIPDDDKADALQRLLTNLIRTPEPWSTKAAWGTHYLTQAVAELSCPLPELQDLLSKVDGSKWRLASHSFVQGQDDADLARIALLTLKATLELEWLPSEHLKLIQALTQTSSTFLLQFGGNAVQARKRTGGLSADLKRELDIVAIGHLNHPNASVQAFGVHLARHTLEASLEDRESPLELSLWQTIQRKAPAVLEAIFYAESDKNQPVELRRRSGELPDLARSLLSHKDQRVRESAQSYLANWTKLLTQIQS